MEGNMFKLIVVIGFQNSGKSTLMSNLYTRLSGKTCDPDTRFETVTCPLGKNPCANVYLGFDGDDYACVSENLERIQKGQYDVGEITLRRASYYPGYTGKGWQKWIDKWIIDNGYPSPFDNYERYYVHTLVPMIYRPSFPQGCNPLDPLPPSVPPIVSALEALAEGHIVDLLNLII
jgi:hypothetical protein